MAVQRRAEARWDDARQRWRIDVQMDGTRKSFYSYTKGKRGKTEAERAADHWLASGSLGGGERLKTAMEAWLAYDAETRGADNPTLIQHRDYARRYILPRLGHKRLGALTQHDWQSCLDYAYAERRLSRKTLENLRGCITAFLRYCRSRRIDTPQLYDDLTIPRDAEYRERHILQPDALRVLFGPGAERDKCNRPVWYIHAWRIMVVMGWRPGEVIGLQWRDLDGDTVAIQRAINVTGKLTRGKNDNARRAAVLPPAALAEIEAQREMLAAHGVKSMWVFPARDGSPAPEHRVYECLASFLRRRGLQHVSLYELRHTMVSINRDTPDAYLKPVVGHSAAMDTRRQYGHDLDDARQRAAEYLQAAIDGVLG